MSTGYLAIVNPAAGGGTGKRTAATAIGALRDAGISVDVVETQAAGDGTRIASEAYGEGRRDFISVGGDGTSYEVINGLMPACANTDERPSLAIVPAGTGNSFLRDFTEDGVQTAIDALLHDRVRDCDIVRVEHTKGTVFSINLFSLGFVAQVGALTNRRFKRFGEMGYVLGVLTMLAKLKPVSLPMRVNGGALRDDAVTFLSINNSQFGHVLEPQSPLTRRLKVATREARRELLLPCLPMDFHLLPQRELAHLSARRFLPPLFISYLLFIVIAFVVLGWRPVEINADRGMVAGLLVAAHAFVDDAAPGEP